MRHHTRYDAEKTTQIACELLQRNGGEMNYMKLLKLLYIIDREAFKRWGESMTGDTYFAMKHGPVLSLTLNLISEGSAPSEEGTWHQHISVPRDYSVSLVDDDFGNDQLSKADLEVLDDVYNRFGAMDKWALVKYCHDNFREWSDPAPNGRARITPDEIMQAVGKDESFINRAGEENDAFIDFQSKVALYAQMRPSEEPEEETTRFEQLEEG